uniref:Uncharacterized protein n=1 Tax=Glossina austeni TaxID=7395 RepID=A0A1A9UFC2_GLOAU
MIRSPDERRALQQRPVNVRPCKAHRAVEEGECRKRRTATAPCSLRRPGGRTPTCEVPDLELKASHTRSLDNFNPLITNSLHERCTLNTSLQSMKISLRSQAEEEIVRDVNRKRALVAAYELNSFNNLDGFCIQQLKGLCSLNMKGCNKITDVTLKYGLKFNELKRLFLSSRIELSIGIESLVTLSVHRCRRIYADIEDRLTELSTLHNLNMDNANSMENPELFRLKRRFDY